jgi:hypothetical protein
MRKLMKLLPALFAFVLCSGIGLGLGYLFYLGLKDTTIRIWFFPLGHGTGGYIVGGVIALCGIIGGIVGFHNTIADD